MLTYGEAVFLRQLRELRVIRKIRAKDAGTPPVLASLWVVNDRSAGILMHNFYGQLRQADKATAVMPAQRRMGARSGPHAHPYFWAPFVLVGQMN
ncbi:MAG TPA: CHAT domain-containing protein [Pyrinomonadaceae bacterium]|nr:CHAT domain-containing protein [Pyrinomonadaceae bacterium]